MSFVITIAILIVALGINEIMRDLQMDSIKYPVYVWYTSLSNRRVAWLRRFFNLNKNIKFNRGLQFAESDEMALREINEQSMMDVIQNEFEFSLVNGLDLELSQSDDGVLIHTTFATQQISLRGLYMDNLVDRLKKGARRMLYGEIQNQGIDLTDWDQVFEL